MITETIALLGLSAKDRVTGFNGVITSACFDLYGCVQVIITPPAKDGTELVDGRWFDVNRVTITAEERAMPVPQFDSADVALADYCKGPAEKRLPTR